MRHRCRIVLVAAATILQLLCLKELRRREHNRFVDHDNRIIDQHNQEVDRHNRCLMLRSRQGRTRGNSEDVGGGDPVRSLAPTSQGSGQHPASSHRTVAQEVSRSKPHTPAGHGRLIAVGNKHHGMDGDPRRP